MLHYKLVRVTDLRGSLITDMFACMQANYGHVDRAVFERDLFQKDFAGLILDEENQIQGFTTYAIDPKGTGTQAYHIIFSGDTIIQPDHWGSQVMMQGWCETVGRFIAGDPEKKWYWYLLSKGHRTYMYLPLFFKTFFPQAADNEDQILKEIAGEVSEILYGSSWKEKEGVIRFDQSQGELLPELAEATYRKKNSQHVSFFLEKNPGFYKGEELVCLAEIHPHNMLRSAKDLVMHGMKSPLHLNEG